ncbi:MAG: X-Pro dipeptidyl-peptidase [Actinomycetota bacterium]|jgi:X-Pro dipeptidyl-peptidase|nr:X-Pro dipeptidyl-peptidase [Actinomycetota bacterium]
MRSLRALLPAALVACALAVPAAQSAAAADIQYDVVQIPTVGGAHIRVEIQRDKRFDKAKQPVILTYSPYSSLAEPQTAADGIATRYNPLGYARAVADVIGTRGSSGCWDYGGKNEQQSGADVVRYLSKLPWSSGKVGMTGVSYEGTTANMVAALGDKISASANGGRGLAGIIPVASISHWYGYAYYDGVRYAGNSKNPTDEGIDTPLGFDFGFAATLPADPSSPGWAEAAQSRAGECDKGEHTMQGYSKNPDYGPFWQERDYRKDAAKFRVPVLVVHGWQDYNVKQDEGLSLYDALPVDNPRTKAVEGVPFKKIWLTQSQHADGSGPGYQDLVDKFWERTLKGVHNGVERLPVATSLGRNSSGATKFVPSTSWPPAGTSRLTLNLGLGSLVRGRGTPETTETYFDTATVTEEASLRGAKSGMGNWVYHESAPLKAAMRIAGSATLDAVVNVTSGDQQLDPLLVEVAADGTVSLVERGFLNLEYRNGLAKADPKAGWLKARVTFLPQDYTFAKGSRIGLIIESSNTVWAVPGSAGQVAISISPQPGVSKLGTQLTLPVVGLRDPKAVLPK